MLEFTKIADNSPQRPTKNTGKLRVGNLMRRVFSGLQSEDQENFLRDIDRVLGKYYIKSNMQPPILSLHQKAKIMQNRLLKDRGDYGK